MKMAGSYRYNYNSIHNGEKFTVYINEGEVNQIKRWVLEWDNIETGGDLFGLWIDDRTAVVQFVLGPGEKCRRTSMSFFQDIVYLREAGNFLTQKHGLCNIGQWHSHHRLSLTQPSGGDESTVWGNMPNLGLNRYIVCIATINSNRKPTASVNPYLFEIKGGRRNGVLQGSFEYMKENSPFRLDKSIQSSTKKGAEKINEIEIFVETRKLKRPYSETESGSTNSRESKQLKPEVEKKSQNDQNSAQGLVGNGTEATTKESNEDKPTTNDVKEETKETKNGKTPQASRQGSDLDTNIFPFSEENSQSNESENSAKDEVIQTKEVEAKERPETTEETLQNTEEEQKIMNGKTSEKSTNKNENPPETTMEYLPPDEDTENEDNGIKKQMKLKDSDDCGKDENIQQQKDTRLPVASGKIQLQSHKMGSCRRNKGQENTEKSYISELKIRLKLPKKEITFFASEN